MKTINFRTHVLLGLLTLMLTNNSFAQTEEQASLYMFNPLLFNPAYAGSRGSISAVGIGRFQWVGIDGAPTSQFLSVHAPVSIYNIGVGLHASNDKIGARSRTSVSADVSYGIRLNKKGHRLNFGLSAGADWQVYDFQKTKPLDPNDPIYTYYASKVRPNFGAGLYYYGERHFAGFSIPRLLRNRIGDGVNIGEALQRRHFYITGGYVFKLNSVVDFKPSTLIKITENAPITFDLNANFLLFNTLWIGSMYRFHESVGINMALQIKEFMTFGYAFDFPVNGMNIPRTNQKGTHEIMVSFDFMSKRRPYLSPRYF